MQLTIEKKVEQKEFVEVPNGYYRHGEMHFSVFDGEVLCVRKESIFSDGEIKILTPEKHSILIAITMQGEMITEEEFDAAYCEIHNRQAKMQMRSKLLKTA